MGERKTMTVVATLGALLCYGACSSPAALIPAPPAPAMPADWTVVSDFEVPAEQTRAIAQKLGVELTSLRNTLYDVEGKSVQLNVLITPDAANADAVMAKLRSMKGEVALLRRDLIVYELVGGVRRLFPTPPISRRKQTAPHWPDESGTEPCHCLF